MEKEYEELPEIKYTDVSCSYSETILFELWSVDFPNFGTILNL